jgi:cbb3-type cytochrome oxidase subunit 1
MHSLVRKYIKVSFLYLTAGLLLGFYLSIGTYAAYLPVSPMLVTAHVHLLLVGFVMMMILGVSQWMFPRPERGDSRYNAHIAEAVFYAITGGVFLRTAGEIVSAFRRTPTGNVLIVAGSALELLAILVFLYNIRTRIRPIGSHLREAAGEKF